VGLCHSVQGCAWWLAHKVGIKPTDKLQWHIAGINHQAWLLEITDNGKDLYPEIKKRAAARIQEIRRAGGARKVMERASRDWQKKKIKWWEQADHPAHVASDMVRLYTMLKFGYYVTESSEHNAEYMPYWIKRTHPELIDRYNIPLDEYPRRCVSQIKGWKRQRDAIVNNKQLTHTRGGEYGSYIMEAIETDVPAHIGGNVLNTGLVANLPAKAIVEVPCLVDRNGVQGCVVGDLPEACAAMNRSNINVQLLTLEAAFTRKREAIIQAALMDPHTAAELSIDEIVRLCNDLIKAHGNYLPKYR
jgi:alpha-galactosidase